jgi:GMP reductase
MRIDHEPKLDFDDVLIRPKRSEAPSRATVVLEREYPFLNSRARWKGIPLVAANMDTVGTMAMAEALGPAMMTCLHKYYPEDRLIEFFRDEVHGASTFFTLGIKDDEFEKLQRVRAKAPIRFICVDAANGYTKYFVERVERIREAYPELTIMAGNVATPEMVQELLISGAADIVKIGIGPGSVCTTRMMTGVGYPQLSAIIECADAAHGLRGHVCADGGCRSPGDVAKAFAAGADFVMLGACWPVTTNVKGSGSRRAVSGSPWRSTACRAGEPWTSTPEAARTIGPLRDGRSGFRTGDRSGRRSRRSPGGCAVPAPTSGRPG